MQDQADPSDPAAGVTITQQNVTARGYISQAQAEALTHAAGTWGDVVVVPAQTGIRWDEIAALAGRVDQSVKHRASTHRTVVDTKGRLVWNNPKGHNGTVLVRRDPPFRGG